MDVPAPLEWHPAYRDKTWLIDWVEGRSDIGHGAIRLPVMRPVSAFWSEEETAATSATGFPTMTMTRRLCAGPAPWIGYPYHYEWWVGVDDLDRCIAGDSRMIEERGETFYRIRATDPSVLPVYGEEPPEDDPLSDEMVKATLTQDEAVLLVAWVQRYGPIPDGRLHEAVQAIRDYLT